MKKLHQFMLLKQFDGYMVLVGSIGGNFLVDLLVYLVT